MSSTACPEDRRVNEYAASGAACGSAFCAHLGTAALVGHLGGELGFLGSFQTTR